MDNRPAPSWSAVGTLALLITVAAVAGPAAPKIRTVGYFRANNGEVIKTKAFSHAAEADIRADAMAEPHRAYRMMAVYYFSEGKGIPGQVVSSASNIDDVNDLLYEGQGVPAWRYAFMWYTNKGTPDFIDCHQEPGNDLCRHK